MRGIFSKLPADTLAAAMAPAADRCASLDWAVSLYDGAMHIDDYDDPAIKPFVNFADVQLEVGLFRSGFLPRHADRLLLDKFSYFLGFDRRTLSEEELARRLGDGYVLQPRARLFQLVVEHDLLYLLRICRGWWEAYTPDRGRLDQIHHGWCGEWTESDRWAGNAIPKYPGASIAT